MNQQYHDNFGYFAAKVENDTNYYEVPNMLILGLPQGKLKTGTEYY
jgi:hypothetical protein